MGPLLAIVGAQALGQAIVSDNPLNNSLFVAIREHNPVKVRALIKQGAKPNATYANGWPMIIEAVNNADSKPGLEVLRILIHAGANVNAAQPDQGWTPLHQVCGSRMSTVEVAKLLLSKGANKEAQMPSAGTPLHLAARFSRLDLVKLLVESGANIEAKASASEPVIEDIQSHLPPEVRAEFKERNAEFEKQFEKERAESKKRFEAQFEPGYDMVGRTPLIEAAASSEFGKSDIVDYLLSKGANVHATDSIGRTALHEAAQMGNVLAVRSLLRNGANVDQTTKNGLTPLHASMASIIVSPETIETLLKSGAEINAQTKDGRTPLDRFHMAMSDWKSRSSGAPESERKQFSEFESDLQKKIEASEELLNRHGGRSGTDLNPWWTSPVNFFFVLIVVIVIYLWSRNAVSRRLNELSKRR